MVVTAAKDEFIHQNYPRGSNSPWRENYYYVFIDREQQAWGKNHFSLERHTRKGIFTAANVIDGKVIYYENKIDIHDDFSELNDGKLHLEILEPLKKHHLIFQGLGYSLDLTFVKRFEPFDYSSQASNVSYRQNEAFQDLQHYEQAMTVTGTLTKEGKSRPISCFGYRDHSWGYRNYQMVVGWNFVVAFLPQKVIHASIIRLPGKKDIQNGYIATSEGIVVIPEVKVTSIEYDENNAPVTTTYELKDESGRSLTLNSRRFSTIPFPIVGKKSGTKHENFSEYTVIGNGERGIGIDEHMYMEAGG